MPGTTEWFQQLPLPSTVICFSVLPGIAFSLDLVETAGKYGVVEVFLSSAIAAGVFSVFGGQRLCILGVTGTLLRVGTLMSRKYSLSHRKSHNRIKQDNLRHSEKYLGCSGLPVIHGVARVYLWGAIFTGRPLF
jgi:hypothetical protein